LFSLTSIKHMMGEIQMTNEERFEGINFNHNQYEKEARKRWGDQPVNKINAKLERMTKDEHKGLSEKWDMIFNKLALLRDQSPKSKEVQVTIKEWYDFLNENFGKYSPDAFYGLGQLYINDERFTKNIDQYGHGLANFMSEAMKVYSDNQK
ncbi:TipAS antibiotic-recognition domain-containing protein, partial [Anoxybacillus kestanbolensis]|uniref:TipAS antibiotic-recognition domain-containing protein n=1 Tax=Anoxybacillus kestanbolensis TaxID=227476 RepID=UPI003D199F95